MNQRAASRSSGVGLLVVVSTMAICALLVTMVFTVTNAQQTSTRRTASRAAAKAYADGVIESLYDQWRTAMIGVTTSADRLGISYAEHLANGCYYVLAVLTFIAAFDQLNIQFALLEKLILMAFGALAVGFGLALGLGGRDVMAGILAGYYVRQRLQSGDHVSIGHMEGTVREVGPVATIIQDVLSLLIYFGCVSVIVF